MNVIHIGSLGCMKVIPCSLNIIYLVMEFKLLSDDDLIEIDELSVFKGCGWSSSLE